MGMPRQDKERRRIELACEQDVVGVCQKHVRNITRHTVKGTIDVLSALMRIVNSDDRELAAPHVDNEVFVPKNLDAMETQPS